MESRIIGENCAAIAEAPQNFGRVETDSRRDPKVSAHLPLNREPSPWAASSTMSSPCLSAMACRASMLQVRPLSCVGMMALVLEVVAASTAWGSMR